MRVLIADDEAPARARLRQLLASHADVEIAGEAENGIQAMELAGEIKPDLLLLDIQMPGCTGIDVAACLAEPRPQIVFCTAFDQHAVDAFELHAVDYLLKPISRTRLAQALDRVRQRGEANPETVNRALESQRHLPMRFLVKHADAYVVIPESRVLFFSSEGGLTRVVTETAQYWMDPTLNALEQRVNPSRFFRISRAALISLNAVSEIHPLPGGASEVLLKNGQRLDVSRRRFQHLLKALDPSQ